MDRVALHILCRELEADSAVLRDAAARARERVSANHPGHLEAAGFELNRAYNIIEKAFERVCAAFENHFEKRGDYHERLIERLSLELPGFRPAFLPADSLASVRELKNFRHVFRHAYDIEFRPERVAELSATAHQLARDFPVWVRQFEEAIPAWIELQDSA